MTHSPWKRTIATIGIGMSALLLSACGETEPVEVPDVVGMTGYDARDELQGQDFKTDMNSSDGSMVLNTGNWEVESTDPAAGEMVDPKSEVTVNLVRPEEEQEDEAQEEPEEEADASAEETEFEFFVEDYDFGRQVQVTWEIEIGFTGGGTERNAKEESLEAIQQARALEPDYDQISLNGYMPTTDDYGNESRALAIVAGYNRDTVEQINFDNPEEVDLWSINDSGGGCIPCD